MAKEILLKCFLKSYSMFLESLVRLAEIVDHFKQKDDFLISEEFHKQTMELITSQTEFLVTELEFKNNNPGPYSFGIGDIELNIFSPDQTGIQEWAVIARKGNEQSNYRFNSIMGLIKVLSLITKNDKENIE
jgi:hypothetical protein